MNNLQNLRNRQAQLDKRQLSGAAAVPLGD
jgi:hypothetical protein